MKLSTFKSRLEKLDNGNWHLNGIGYDYTI